MIRKPVLFLILLAALNLPFPGYGAEPASPRVRAPREVAIRRSAFAIKTGG
jgi:hypothetical protein